MKSSNGQHPNVSNEMNDIKTDISVTVKAEPIDNDGPCISNADKLNYMPMKKEYTAFDEYDGDELDHMLLKDRLNLLTQALDPRSKSSVNLQFPERMLPSPAELSSIRNSTEPLCIKLPQKRKKTATNSIEIAMEEDAPGLLQVLIDIGVLADEIKLYGSKESDDVIDDSCSEDSFAELESVMSKLFTRQQQSIIKLPPSQHTKSSKADYCLSCLITLIEQSRYLVHRDWPVEWGWCRDLQAFIFVFPKHNRIVLERPEYGYATYFFELLGVQTISWQIKRLVISMKLTDRSRMSLMENRALMVGESLSKGEAKVLRDFGWIPAMGLGTMLNYCDRVFHDRKNEKNGSEWRKKITKMLMDGYNGGYITKRTDIEDEDGDDLSLHVKLEPND